MNKLIWNLIILMLGLVSVTGTTVFAKDVNAFVNTPQFIEIKAKTEELISKRYRDQLSTQLDANSFSVNVSVTLKEKKKEPLPSVAATTTGTNPAAANTDKSKLPEFTGPEDLTTGVVTLMPLLNQYQQELQLLQAQLAIQKTVNQPTIITQQNTEKDQLIEKLEIRGVEVLLGMDSGISSSYRAEIDEWLKNAVLADFGKLGTYKITSIRKMVKPEAPPKVLTSIEKISNLQILLGFGVLASVILLGLFAHKWILSNDVKEQTRTALKIQEMKATLQANERRDTKAAAPVVVKKEPEVEKAKETPNPSSSDSSLEACRDLQVKIFSLHIKMQNLTKNLFELWFEQRSEGRFKAATFIDAILSRKSVDEIKDIQAISNSVLLPEKWLKDPDFHQVFREFPNTTPQEKNAFLEQVYWDMLSVNLLGSKAARAPFDILANLPNDKIQRILHKQDPKTKSLALLHMPSERVQNYLGSVPENERQKIIESALSQQSVPLEEFESANEVINTKAKLDEVPVGYVQLSEQLPNILFSLSAREELNWLPQAFANLPDLGASIKRSYPSIAFVSEWPDEQLKTLFENTDAKIVSTYLYLVPTMSERILAILPNRTALIVRQELNSRKPINPVTFDKSMGELKTHLLQTVESGAVNLESIFINAKIGESPAEPRRKAS